MTWKEVDSLRPGDIIELGPGSIGTIVSIGRNIKINWKESGIPVNSKGFVKTCTLLPPECRYTILGESI